MKIRRSDISETSDRAGIPSLQSDQYFFEQVK
jgi:hypothetical protein